MSNARGLVKMFITFSFFFQAEDGIRDGRVTGVQTCALPIWTEWIYFTVVAVIILGYVGWMISVYRTKIKKALKVKEIQLFIFCFVFAFVSLLPFLPLGNIAPRYLYLASFGYTLALVVLFKLLFTKWVKNAKYAV